MSPFRVPAYRRLFAAEMSAILAIGLTTIGLTLLAYDLEGGSAGAVIGTALALKMVAYVVVAPLAGAVAGRVTRRRWLVALDLGRALLVLGLPFVTATWQVYALIFLFSAAGAGFTPVFQATIPDVLKDERAYTRALSYSRIAYAAENILSPALTGLLLTALPFRTLFGLGTGLYLASAALILSATLPAALKAVRTGSRWRDLTAGLRLYLATPRLRGLLALTFSVATASAMVIVNSLVYLRDHLHRPETSLAILLGGYGVGAILAASAVPRLVAWIGDRPLMVAAGLLLGVLLAAGALRPDFPAAVALWAGLGFAEALILTPTGRLLQRSSTPPERPALYAAEFALSHACWLVTYPLAGWVGVVMGLPATFALLGLLALAAAVLAAALWPREHAGAGVTRTPAG